MSTTVTPGGATGEQTLLEAALARLDSAALAVTRSAATTQEQHEILGSLVAAHSLLHALCRLDPAAVDELLAQATRLAGRLSQPKPATAGLGLETEGAGRPAGRSRVGAPRHPPRGRLMRAAYPHGSLQVAWRCWLLLLLAGYAVLIVTCATAVTSAIWQGSGIARPAALVLLGVYALEGWALWRWAGQAATLLPPIRPGRYVLVALVQTAVGVGLGWMVLGR